MQYIGDRLGKDIHGRAWAPDVLYLVALGRRYLQGKSKGIASTDEATRKAAAQAAAVAAASAPGGVSPAPVGGKEDQNSDNAVMGRILKAGSNSIFKL